MKMPLLATVLLAACAPGERAGSVEGDICVCPGDPDAAPDATPPARVLAFYGDSILWGQGASVPPLAVATLVATTYPGAVVLDAAKGRALTEEVDGAPLARLVAYDATEYWLGIGTNDYRHGTVTPAQFSVKYAALVDGLHTAHPTARIYCQTMLWLVSRGANKLGYTAQNYRDVIRSTCNYAIRPWATLAEGIKTTNSPAVLKEDGSQQVDGTHLNDSGQASYAAWIRATGAW